MPNNADAVGELALTRSQAEEMLARESRLLDERRLTEWLDMFTEDCLYWVPGLREKPHVEGSLIYDSRERLEQRIFRLTETVAHAQLPPSETHHHVSNVEVGELQADGASRRIGANVLIMELRHGDPSQVGLGEQRLLSARCSYDVTMSGQAGWKIRQKKVVLLTRGLPQYNLSFML